MKSRLIPIFLLMVSNAATGTVIETSDYLPYGTRWSQTGGSAAQTLSDPDNRWRYSGKEEQQTLHQDLPLIDYGARMYDPTVARWMSPDPLAEKYYPMGQYIYCGNNSVNVIDPLGDDWYSVKDEKGQIQYKSDTGDLTLEGQLFKGIDDLIIKNYSSNIQVNNIFDSEIPPEPSVDFNFNLPQGEYNFIYSGYLENQIFKSNKDGSIYRSVQKDKMLLKIQQMPPKEPRRFGGYKLGYREREWYGCFMLIGNNNFNTVQIQFDKENAALFWKALNKQFAGE